MNKAGFVFSLIGGIFAILFSVLLVITGPYFFAGSDISAFVEENEDDLVLLWRDIGEYHDVPILWQTELDEYVDKYSEILQNMDAEELRDIGDTYQMDAFDDLSRIYRHMDDYIPRLKFCVIACLISSVIAFAGAAIAKVARVAGSVMVFAAAGLLLIFSLLASSILPMALASLLLLVGGLLQIARPRVKTGKEAV